MPFTLGNITLYDLYELEEKLFVSIVTLRAYIRAGNLKARKVAGRYLVSEECLKEFFNHSPERQEALREKKPVKNGMMSCK